MSVFKEQCIDLRRKDHTLSEIVKITGRPKTSVHFHIQDFPLSNLRKKKVQAARAFRARLLARKRRGVSARLFKKFTSWNTELICLVSHLVFDGEVKHGGCVYNNRNMALLNRVEQCMKTIYPLEPKRYIDAVTGVSRISYYNVTLAAYIRGKSTKLLAEIKELPKELKREFLRSFFDDEGCMDYNVNKKHRRIRGYQKNIAILKIIKELLRHFHIESHIQPPNEIVIVRKENFIRFQKEIGFSPGVRINGKRSNSIWKQHLEKREILRRAIESYKPLGSNGVHRH